MARQVYPSKTKCSACQREPGGCLTEDGPVQEDRDGRDQVNHGTHATSARQPESKRPCRKADRRWEDAEVDNPAERGHTGVFYVLHERRPEWQQGQGRGGATQPRDLGG